MIEAQREIRVPVPVMHVPVIRITIHAPPYREGMGVGLLFPCSSPNPSYNLLSFISCQKPASGAIPPTGFIFFLLFGRAFALEIIFKIIFKIHFTAANDLILIIILIIILSEAPHRLSPGRAFALEIIFKIIFKILSVSTDVFALYAHRHTAYTI